MVHPPRAGRRRPNTHIHDHFESFRADYAHFGSLADNAKAIQRNTDTLLIHTASQPEYSQGETAVDGASIVTRAEAKLRSKFGNRSPCYQRPHHRISYPE
jgi:hypothetical protein